MGRAYPTLFAETADDWITVTGDTACCAFVLDRYHGPITNEAPVGLHITLTGLRRIPWAMLIAAADHPGICAAAGRNDIAVTNNGNAYGACGGFNPIQLTPNIADLQRYAQAEMSTVTGTGDDLLPTTQASVLLPVGMT